ncbi:hypothetical protein [Enterobacter ludwigii]|nr:hypothetical protein [Enterobacter ludwigii]
MAKNPYLHDALFWQPGTTCNDLFLHVIVTRFEDIRRSFPL